MKTRRTNQAFLATIISLIALPCSASYAEGLATFVAFYYAVITVAVSYPIILLLCYFRIFKHGTALLAHALLALAGASTLIFLSASEVRESKGMLLVVVAALLLFLIAIIPSATQYLYFRRKRRIAYEKSLGDPTLAQVLASKTAIRDVAGEA